MLISIDHFVYFLMDSARTMYVTLMVCHSVIGQNLLLLLKIRIECIVRKYFHLFHCYKLIPKQIVKNTFGTKVKCKIKMDKVCDTR